MSDSLSYSNSKGYTAGIMEEDHVGDLPNIPPVPGRSRSGTLMSSDSEGATGRVRSGTMMSGKSDNLYDGTQFSLPAQHGTVSANGRERSVTLDNISMNPSMLSTAYNQLTTYLKYLLSSVLTLTYVAYIFWGIWTNQAVLPAHPVAHFFIFIFCMTLVAYLEGLQVAILANEKESPEKKRESHPRAYKLMTSVREGNNVERFLVGRQFFTIFVMTLMAQVTSFPSISHLGIPEVLWFIFVQTGLPGAMVVATIGSLQPQLLAAKDSWQFLNLRGSYSVLQLCYALESSGICTHFSWGLIYIFRHTIFVTDKQPKKRKDDKRKGFALVLEGLKYVVSTCVLLTYVSYLMWGIWTDQAILPIPGIAVFCTLLLCFVCLALLEGLQVAILVAETSDPEGYADTHQRAYALMKRAMFEKNVRRFLIGRQFFLVFIVFLVNQCTIFPYIYTFGIPEPVWFVFIQLGLPTALTVLCFAQLPAQLLANQDSTKFMNRYGSRFFLEVCLFTEKTGLAHFSWVATNFSKKTWFPINVTLVDEISQYKDLNSIQKIRAEYEVTALCDDLSAPPTASVRTKSSVELEDEATNRDCISAGTGSGGQFLGIAMAHTEEIDLEMHTDLSHALADGE